jgi:hypothetical protein
VESTELLLEGEAWIDVRFITLDGASEPLELRWTDDLSWQATLQLQDGPNELLLVATDLRDAVVGSDSIVVTALPSL